MDDVTLRSGMQAGPLADVAAFQPLDRISVREHVREVDLSCGEAEGDLTQPLRLRFDVGLDIVHGAAGITEKCERVLSHRAIIAVIDAVLDAGRCGTIEALAEAVAQGCLDGCRAIQVQLRVERIGGTAGAFGVEIVRRRPGPARPAVRSERRERFLSVPGSEQRPFVAYLPVSTLAGLRGAEWCDALAEWAAPCVICVAPLVPQPAPTSDGQLRIGLLAIEQSAWALSDHDPRFQVVSSRAEIGWALHNRVPAIWAPSEMVAGAGAAASGDASDPAELAAWLARELGGEFVLLGEAEEALLARSCGHRARSPEQLQSIPSRNRS